MNLLGSSPVTRVKNVLSSSFFSQPQKSCQSGPCDFCRICACSFAIRLRNLGKMSRDHICTENLFRRCCTVVCNQLRHLERSLVMFTENAPSLIVNMDLKSFNSNTKKKAAPAQNSDQSQTEGKKSHFSPMLRAS